MRVGGCEFGGAPTCDEGGEGGTPIGRESWSRRSEITNRAPRLPGCDHLKITKNKIPLSIISVDNPRFPAPHHTRQLLLLGQATEYLAPAPLSGSFEPDNAAAAY